MGDFAKNSLSHVAMLPTPETDTTVGSTGLPIVDTIIHFITALKYGMCNLHVYKYMVFWEEYK